MFALEWCEFCWSVRKMFGEVGIPFKSIDLDSVAFQKDNLGGDIRAALRELIDAPKIPQIFVGGKHIGGCTETFDAFNDGSLKKLLTENSVTYDQSNTPDAYGFLPTWLHPR
ncbi:MAG: glutaredoxin domain-containing protein [Paracoccaceae bacterium]